MFLEVEKWYQYWDTFYAFSHFYIFNVRTELAISKIDIMTSSGTYWLIGRYTVNPPPPPPSKKKNQVLGMTPSTQIKTILHPILCPI